VQRVVSPSDPPVAQQKSCPTPTSGVIAPKLRQIGKVKNKSYLGGDIIPEKWLGLSPSTKGAHARRKYKRDFIPT